jgi:putative ABC transport system permease protein|tara:strand:- start:2077 stop:3330 length:1254 start_codon:yes stop_codon:yes gene_type:complete
MIKIRQTWILEAVNMAAQSLRSQMLRASLTALIIATGITALVGMLTATSVMESSISNQFTTMGANTFSIQSGGQMIRIGRNGKREKRQEQIPIRTAKILKENLLLKGLDASLSDDLLSTAIIRHREKETNPNVRVQGVDLNFMSVNGLEIKDGRYFSGLEEKEARSVAIIAPDIVNKLFQNTSAIGKMIRINGKPFQVIGITKEKGNSSFMASDNLVYLPLMTGLKDFGSSSSSIVTSILAPGPEKIDAAINEAIATMRSVRKLSPGEGNDFNIRRSDNLSSILIESLSSVSIGAALIGFITLLGASISLMNIMLVSVTERTSEIGIRKALGASENFIITQFLSEAILVSLIGGIFGICLGLIVGNGLAFALDTSVVLPFKWILLAFIVSFLVGIISGWYPARTAAKLDPIEALRYE